MKKFVHQIKKEGAAPVNYISPLKESITINNKPTEVIYIEKLTEFLTKKNVPLKEDEIEILYENYKVNQSREKKEEKKYISFESFSEKLLKIIQNDSDNDEDILDGIPVMESSGMNNELE